MEASRLLRVVLRTAVLATGALIASAAAPAGSRDTFANGVHNAGITWGSGDGPIYGANVDGSGRHVLVPQFADSEGDPAWTRDGRTLAFFGMFSDTSEIFVIRPGEPKYRRPIPWRCGQPFVRYAPPLKRWLRRARCRFLGRPANFRSFEPAWSPDAKRIAVSYEPLNAESTIRVVAVATNKWTSVTTPKRHSFVGEPAWSPDGRTIAFVRQTKHTPPTIFLIRPEGSGVRRLTAGRSPSWSPDGTHLVFALDGRIYEVRAVSGGAKRMILSGFRHPLVRWSPDGTRLLIASGRNAWVTDADGRHRIRVLHERNDIYGLAWRPG